MGNFERADGAVVRDAKKRGQAAEHHIDANDKCASQNKDTNHARRLAIAESSTTLPP